VTISLVSADVRLLRKAMMQMLSPYAASSERRWLLGVTDILKKLLRADKGAVRLMNGNKMSAITEDVDDRALVSFAEYYHKFDAGRAVAGSVSRLPRVWTIDESYGDRLGEFYKSEYYNDFHIPWKTFHGLCVSHKTNPGPLDGVMYFHKERRSSPEFDARAKAILRIFRPALRSGLQQEFAAAQPDAVSSTIDQLTDGCALVTLSGISLHHNPALRRLMEKDRHTSILPAAISAAVAAMASLASDQGCDGLVNAAAPELVLVDHVPYALSSCCLGHFAGINEPVILVTIAPADGGSRSGLLRAIDPGFKLSARESEVAILLAERKTNGEIASRLGISAHTVRHHTERVLKKLGLDRKSSVGGEFGLYTPSEPSGT